MPRYLVLDAGNRGEPLGYVEAANTRTARDHAEAALTALGLGPFDRDRHSLAPMDDGADPSAYEMDWAMPVRDEQGRALDDDGRPITRTVRHTFNLGRLEVR